MTHNKPISTTISPVSKSKLDKAQAKRLKMPKRNRSAYFLFSMDTRAKLKAESKDQQLTPLELQAKVSQYWKELTPSQKKVYETRAKQEKIEYLVAVDKFYSNLTPETLERSKVDRPKKPCSAYAHFVRDVKNELKRENPKLIMQEILHIVSDKWKNLPEAERFKYEEKARLDKDQYLMATHRYFPALQKISEAKSRSYQMYQKPVKQFEKSCEEESSIEGQSFKKIKVEPSIAKTEESSNGGNFSFDNVKTEQDHRNMCVIDSPFMTKNESEAQNETQPSLKLEPLTMEENFGQYGMNQQLIVPELNMQHHMSGFPGNQNINFDINERMRQLTAAKMSWMRFAQASKSVDEVIMRKLIEAKTLQAQRLRLVQNLFWSPNNGGAF